MPRVQDETHDARWIVTMHRLAASAAEAAENLENSSANEIVLWADETMKVSYGGIVLKKSVAGVWTSIRTEIGMTITSHFRYLYIAKTYQITPHIPKGDFFNTIGGRQTVRCSGRNE